MTLFIRRPNACWWAKGVVQDVSSTLGMSKLNKFWRSKYPITVITDDEKCDTDSGGVKE